MYEKIVELEWWIKASRARVYGFGLVVSVPLLFFLSFNYSTAANLFLGMGLFMMGSWYGSVANDRFRDEVSREIYKRENNE